MGVLKSVLTATIPRILVCIHSVFVNLDALSPAFMPFAALYSILQKGV